FLPRADLTYEKVTAPPLKHHERAAFPLRFTFCARVTPPGRQAPGRVPRARNVNEWASHPSASARRCRIGGGAGERQATHGGGAGSDLFSGASFVKAERYAWGACVRRRA